MLKSLKSIQITAIPGIPLIEAGDDLAALIMAALHDSGVTLQAHDILVVTSKIVSKAEDRRLDLRTITPTPRAEEVAAVVGKDARLVQVVLDEATEISRMSKNVLVTRHRLGFISANSAIDQSNVGSENRGDATDPIVLLLPIDPDHSAATIRDRLRTALNVEVGVVISDTHGRPFRLGNMGVAIGSAGLPALLDLRGRPDLFNRRLQHTDIALADELASAADLLSGQADEGLPVTLIRGLQYPTTEGKASDLVRPVHMDLYRDKPS